MKTDDVRQLTSADAEYGTLKLADGREVVFIELLLGVLHQGTQHTLPVVTMSPEQARRLGAHLMATADTAQRGGSTPVSH